MKFTYAYPIQKAYQLEVWVDPQISLRVDSLLKGPRSH